MSTKQKDLTVVQKQMEQGRNWTLHLLRTTQPRCLENRQSYYLWTDCWHVCGDSFSYLDQPEVATTLDYIKITQVREDLTVVAKLMQQIVNADDPKAKIAEIIADLKQPPAQWMYLRPRTEPLRCNDFIEKKCVDWIYSEWEKWT